MGEKNLRISVGLIFWGKNLQGMKVWVFNILMYVLSSLVLGHRGKMQKEPCQLALFMGLSMTIVIPTLTFALNFYKMFIL